MTTNTLQQVASEGLQQAIELIRSAGSEAAQQIPDVAQQYVRFTAVESGIWILAASVAIWGGIWLFRSGLKHETESYSDETKPALLILGGFVIVVFSVFLVFRAITLAKCVSAPKVLILERARWHA